MGTGGPLPQPGAPEPVQATDLLTRSMHREPNRAVVDLSEDADGADGTPYISDAANSTCLWRSHRVGDKVPYCRVARQGKARGGGLCHGRESSCKLKEGGVGREERKRE